MNRDNIQSTTRTNTLCIRTGTGSHTRPAKRVSATRAV